MSYLRKLTGNKIWTIIVRKKSETLQRREGVIRERNTIDIFSICEIELECGHWIYAMDWTNGPNKPKRKRKSCLDCIEEDL